MSGRFVRWLTTMNMFLCSARVRFAPVFLCALFGVAPGLRADCTVTNLGLRPLPEIGFGFYRTNFQGGLYPGGSNHRPSAHESAGLNIAQNQIRPRNFQGSVDTNSGKIVWIKQALASPHNYGAFPAHAVALQDMLEQILRVAMQQFPNLKIAYLSSRTRAYRFNDESLNPEPYAYEDGFSTKWLVEKQLNGQLNFDPAQDPAVVPWISWGPYLWGDGSVPRSDGLTWLCTDLESDFTHPNTNGVAKVGPQLLAFFKTDGTATPWFLKQIVTNLPPYCSANAVPTNGGMPLAVNFTANAGDSDGSIRDVQWTFDDGTFSTNTNPAKTFTAPGDYLVHATATDNQGNTARQSLPIRVTTTVAQWKQAKFTTNELNSAAISGDNADPDGDGLRNELEYLMGLEPKRADPSTSRPRAAIAGGYFTLTFSRYRFAGDRTLSAEFSDDLVSWNTFWPNLELSSIVNHGLTETVAYRTPLPAGAGQGFLRLKVE